jgi:hypothetical protein
LGAVLPPPPPPRTHSLSLSHHPHLSAVPNLSPTISPPWTRPRSRVLRPRPRARAPFEPRALLAHLPSLICALCQTPSPSLSLCPREQRAPPPPTVDCCPLCGHRRVCASSRATVSSASSLVAWDTLRCALPPLYFVRSVLTEAILAQPEPCRRRPVVSLRLRHCSVTPTLPLKVSNPPVPLIWSLLLCCSRDCSPELSHTAVSLPRRVQRPLVLPRRREGHGRVRQTARNAPELAPKPLEPHRGQPPRLRRALAAGPSGATVHVSAPVC